MLRIDLNPNLEVLDRRDHSHKDGWLDQLKTCVVESIKSSYPTELASSFEERKKQIEEAKEKADEQRATVTLLSENVQGNSFGQTGIKSMIDTAYFGHLGLTISPDMIWHALLSELALIVKHDHEAYRSLFSKSQQKIHLCCDYNDPVRSAIAELNKVVPTDIGLFLPEFSTACDESRLAFNAAFCKMVSPYYDYSCWTCGIRFVNVTGSRADWERLLKHWTEVGKLFSRRTCDAAYVNQAGKVLRQMFDVTPFEKEHADAYSDAAHFWKNIRNLDGICDPGPNGWIKDLLCHSLSETNHWPRSLGTHSPSVVKFECLNLGHDLHFVAGLLGAEIQDGCVTPKFGHAIYKKESA